MGVAGNGNGSSRTHGDVRTRAPGRTQRRTLTEITRVVVWLAASLTVTVTRICPLPSLPSARSAERERATRIGVVDPAARVPWGATVPQ
jgi:hypothetical protein